MCVNISSIKIIQGGMSVYIATPILAKAVSCQGGLGTVGGTALDRVLARILQQGDIGGHYRRALSHFPFPKMAERVLQEYFVEGGVNGGGLYKYPPILTVKQSELVTSLLVCANFAFVWLAKEGHKNPVSINYLEKIQLPHIYAITGAMLAGVDVVTMGAGITTQVPALLDTIARGETAHYELFLQPSGKYDLAFDTEKFFGENIGGLNRPDFLPIISTDSLACILLKKSTGSIQGFVVERNIAGGHNAPPRGQLKLDETGEPIYGPRDEANFEILRALGLPFWIGGGYASPAGLELALGYGAQGIQVGSIFALSQESGLRSDLRKEAIKLGRQGFLHVRTDLRASPTGFPFKVAVVPGTLSDQKVYRSRERVCNHGALVKLRMTESGRIGYRCAAEPYEHYKLKGGDLANTVDRVCICNGLLSATVLSDYREPAIVTLGNNLHFLWPLVEWAGEEYTVADAFQYLLG